jgi:hypothetical protein
VHGTGGEVVRAGNKHEFAILISQANLNNNATRNKNTNQDVPC